MRKFLNIGLVVLGALVVAAVVYGFVAGVFESMIAGEHAPPLTTSEELSEKGLQEYNAGNLDAAIASFTKAIEMDSSNAVARVRRGIAHGEQGNREAEIAD